MTEAEIRKLFLVIQNSYSGFSDDDFKVALWQQLLDDVTFELAQHNLRGYIRNPENKFPPHPGELARTKAQAADGRYIPNAEETRVMLEAQEREWDKEIRALPPCVGEMKARLKLLAGS